jgi:hypothetical protein
MLTTHQPGAALPSCSLLPLMMNAVSTTIASRHTKLKKIWNHIVLIIKFVGHFVNCLLVYIFFTKSQAEQKTPSKNEGRCRDFIQLFWIILIFHNHRSYKR